MYIIRWIPHQKCRLCCHVGTITMGKWMSKQHKNRPKFMFKSENFSNTHYGKNESIVCINYQRNFYFIFLCLIIFFKRVSSNWILCTYFKNKIGWNVPVTLHLLIISCFHKKTRLILFLYYLFRLLCTCRIVDLRIEVFCFLLIMENHNPQNIRLVWK